MVNMVSMATVLLLLASPMAAIKLDQVERPNLTPDTKTGSPAKLNGAPQTPPQTPEIQPPSSRQLTPNSATPNAKSKPTAAPPAVNVSASTVFDNSPTVPKKLVAMTATQPQVFSL